MTETALARLADLLPNVVGLKPASDRKVVLVLASGKEYLLDRSKLKSALERLVGSSRVRRPEHARQAAMARKRITGQLSHAGAEAEQFEDVEVLFKHEHAEDWALTFNAQEASQVADLAAGAGHQQTAALLRLLVHRYQQGKLHRDKQTVRVEELLDAKEGIEFGWHSLLLIEATEEQLAHWQKLLQTLGGMAKGVHHPNLYAAVVEALNANPRLTPMRYWNRFEVGSGVMYRDLIDGRDVLMHQDDSERGLTFDGLKRYFTRARQSLGIKY